MVGVMFFPAYTCTYHVMTCSFCNSIISVTCDMKYAHISSFICIAVLTEHLHTWGIHPGSTDWSVKEHHMVLHLQALRHGKELHAIKELSINKVSGFNFYWCSYRL